MNNEPPYAVPGVRYIMDNETLITDKTDVTRKKQKTTIWTEDKDGLLLCAIALDKQSRGGSADEEEDWDYIATLVPHTSAVQCLKRYMALQKETQLASHNSLIATINQKPSNTTELQKTASDAKTPPIETKRVDECSGTADWTLDDIGLLEKLVEQYHDAAPRWNDIAANFSNRSAYDCLAKWQDISQTAIVKGKGSWTTAEDQLIHEKLAVYGRKWAKIASFLPGRHGKQCRERYVNHLNPHLKKGDWTDDEEAVLIALRQNHGNRWANISKELPGRSDNDVKNHWYSTVKRKFAQHGERKLVDAAVEQVKLMQQMGNMPIQLTRSTAFAPGLALPHQNGPTFPHHPSIHPYPYQPQYYGPIPPTTPTSASTETGSSHSINPHGPPFMYNHNYPHHAQYPPPNHQHSPQHYQQYHHLPPGQSPSPYQYGVLATGESSVHNEIGKGEMNKAIHRGETNNSPSELGRLHESGNQIDEPEIQLAV